VNSVIKFLFVAGRIFLFLIFFLFYLAQGFWIHWTEKSQTARKAKFSNLAHWITGLCCRTFGIRITVINEPPRGAPGLIIGNHLGFIDILAAGSLRPLLFVTSMEMRETPVLGLLTEMGGCIYVERRNRMGIQAELKYLIESLKQGFNVCLYPEATSHNGDHVLPFKRTLMTAAAHAGVPIYPYVFNFRSVEGQAFSLANRDKVCWYGDIPFLTAMVGAFSLRYVDVEIRFLEPFFPTLEMDRGHIASVLHKRISDHFVPVATSPRLETSPETVRA